MQLQNAFTVPAEPDDAFLALLDLARVAPCMPGAQLTGQDGDQYQGRLHLRIGPISVAYEGSVTIAEADHDGRRATLSARGSEVGGQGKAAATVVATVHPNGGNGSSVEVVTDLDIRGKAAQFGRGAMGEVTQRVLDQFARNLESTFTPATNGSTPAREMAAAAPTEPTAPPTPSPDADLDVLGVIAGPALRRLAPIAGAFLAGLIAGRLLGRRGSTSPAWVAAAPWPTPAGWAPVGPPAGTGQRA